jgi:hypothetical protein
MATKKKSAASGKAESELKLELIGGVFAVEVFPDGREERTELPGEAVLQLVLDAVTEGINSVLSMNEQELKEFKKRAKKNKKQ